MPTLTPEHDKAAHRAVVEFMMMDRDLAYGDAVDQDYVMSRHFQLAQEIVEIFGPNALEFSACYFSGTHASSDDIVVFAATEWEHLKRIFAGEEE